MPWTLCIEQHRESVWIRPLGLGAEQKFFWWSKCDGRSDLVQHVKVTVDATNTHLFGFEQVKEAWISVKMIHPLLASEVEENESGLPTFKVKKARLTAMLPIEVEIMEVENDAQVEKYIDGIVQGPDRKLAPWLQACLVILSPPNKGQTSKTFHVIFVFAHFIADGAAGMRIATTFFDCLTSGSRTAHQFEDEYITRRLELVPNVAELTGDVALSVARRRWRMAIAWAVLNSRHRVLVCVKALRLILRLM